MGLRINFYGGPCVGKSTLAARVYAELNRSRVVRCELVQEFIKLWAYEGKAVDAFDQVFTFASQLRSEHRLFKTGLQVVVTDSPVLLQCVYTKLLDPRIAASLQQIACHYESVHATLNFLVGRTVAYDPHGRFQKPKELEAIDVSIKDALDTLKVPYLAVTPQDLETIVQTAKEAAYALYRG